MKTSKTKQAKYFLSILLSLAFNNITFSQPKWPAITQENKPWTRWWWEGSMGNKADLTAAMETYSKAGLGGMEVTVIYGVKGQEDKFVDYLSPQWMDMFGHILKEGKRLDLGIDLANASGWPFGGPWVETADACKNIHFKTYTLKTGETLSGPITFIQQPFIKAIGQKPELSNLTEPVGKNKNLQLYAIDQVRFEKPLPLHLLMAYSDKGEILDLTNKVDNYGKLDWTAPAGNWTLYALFQGWHGKQVERAGPGGEGDVIDHFSGQAVTNYLEHIGKCLKGYDISYIRAYFNDSYEVDDAQGQADWTPDLLSEFNTRRGYDLRNNLPSLLQQDTPDKNSRVLCDYRQTISDLLLEKYTVKWADWAHQQGKIIRNQSHGSPANILDLYAATDIPETEGNDILRLKFASSAAHVTGKKFASSESATWLNEHFQSSLSDVKYAIDQYFIGGVNHIFYHGTCFSPQSEPWPGWLFYASVEFMPNNSFWNDFPEINHYIARVQSFLQAGKPDNDVLLYFPIFDSYSENTKTMLLHFDGLDKGFHGTGLKNCAETMEDNGYAFDFISDLQLLHVANEANLLQTSGTTYQTLVIPSCRYIPLETFEKAITLAKNGATVIMQGNLPEDVPGWGHLDIRRKTFQQLKNDLQFTNTGIPGIRQMKIGKGKILSGNNLDTLLEFGKIRREPMANQGLQFIRRNTGKGTVYFLANRGNKEVDGWIPLQASARSVALYNAMTGKSGMATYKISPDNIPEVYVQLKPGESLIAETYPNKIKGKNYPYLKTTGIPTEISGNWTVTFTQGGPKLPDRKEITKLTSWTEFDGEEVKNFSGTASYTITFPRPEGNADAWLLNLGRVCESARVILNGNEVATLIGPNYQVVIPAKMFSPENTLEIKVSNLMANHIAYLDRNRVEWKKFYNINFAARLPENQNEQGHFDASKWQPRESGLIGPVTITKAVH
jgi:hypothetical protein